MKEILRCRFSFSTSQFVGEKNGLLPLGFFLVVFLNFFSRVVVTWFILWGKEGKESEESP